MQEQTVETPKGRFVTRARGVARVSGALGLALVLAAGLGSVALAGGGGKGKGELAEADIRDSYHRSYRYEKTQDYDDAIKTLLTVSQAYPEGYTVNLRLGWLYYLAGKFTNAQKHYETAMKVAPYSLDAKLGYTLPLMAREQYKDVELFTRQVLAIDPANYTGNLRLAFALRMQAKLDQAEQVLVGMLLLYPTDVKYLTELGLVHVARGSRDAARGVFREVLVLDPENPVARHQMAQ